MAMAAPAGKTVEKLLEVSDDAVQVVSAPEASNYKSDEKSDAENQDSSEEEDKTLDEVPYKHGTCDSTGLASKTRFDEFLLAAAAKLETRITMLSSIGCIPSYKKPEPGPKLLDDEEVWDVLVANVRQQIKGAQSKNRGKGEVQPFSILIVDMSDELSKTKRKRGTKKSKKDTEDLQEVAHPALKEHELLKKIEKDHYCQACKTACVVLGGDEHHILTHTELATWAMLAVGQISVWSYIINHSSTLGNLGWSSEPAWA
ncbi:hypothetical protein K438DRAFT_1773761 [Mycena galopus ATCC 62051]|nr:hypothetical protein K438DRAFT_1773761 [Mycena galopus ATCC 62051]